MSDNPIWFQRQNHLKAEVSRIYANVEGKFWYVFEIYNTQCGMRKLLQKGKESTLAKAKKEVFHHLDLES